MPWIDADPVCGLLAGERYTFSVWARVAFGNDSALINSVRVTFSP